MVWLRTVYVDNLAYAETLMLNLHADAKFVRRMSREFSHRQV